MFGAVPVPPAWPFGKSSEELSLLKDGVMREPFWSLLSPGESSQKAGDLWRDLIHTEPDPGIFLAELLGRDSPCSELDDLFQDWVETWWS